MTEDLKGACLCGAIRFRGKPDGCIGVCLCGQCRVWGGGSFMEVDMSTGVSIEVQNTLVWYRSSEKSERGFCSVCGSTLFWRARGAGSAMSVSANALQTDHGLRAEKHIWVDDKPDWDDFADDCPRLSAQDALGGSQ